MAIFMMCTKHNLIKIKSTIQHFSRGVKMKTHDENLTTFLAYHFKKPTTEIEKFLEKNPSFIKHDRNHIETILEILKKFSVSLDDLLNYPKLFGLKPVVIENHVNVLLECGFERINLSSIPCYLTLVSNMSIAHLKNEGLIPKSVNVQSRLVNCLSSWPTSPPMAEYEADSKMSLHETRMKVLARYLELNLDLPVEDFKTKIKTYPRIKHRPFIHIDTLLRIYQNNLGMSVKKICSHLGILQYDPSNIKNILKRVKTLAGVDIKEIAFRKPALLNVKYDSLLHIQSILNENKIPQRNQRKCFEIFTLSRHTLEKRLESIKKDPNYYVFLNHPRILRLVVFKKKADTRLRSLKEQNKTCASLNVLSGCELHYQTYARAKGDNTNGRDITSIVCIWLENKFSLNKVHSELKKNKYYITVPIVRAETVHRNISNHFTSEEIFSNCQVLLYPWENVHFYLNLLLNEDSHRESGGKMILGKHSEHIDLKKLSRSVLLSLVLYLLEKDHHFKGDGVWTTWKESVVKTRN